ncbi:hypothetical protein ATCC90586_001150 [Pythium insidiosum]|nr:hypothetical protein ATCC90586_001150 [Pythium insidiosum]
MQALEDEGRRVLKKQRVCADQIHRQLDLLLTEVETAKAQLVEKQDEYRRKRSRGRPAETAVAAADNQRSDDVDHPDEQTEVRDDEMEHIVQEFIERVKLLNLDKSVADELKTLHVALAKYGKQIDKVNVTDRGSVGQLIAEYLYHDGQIDAADALCQEAKLTLPGNYRECFVELHSITSALKEKNMTPALEWSRKNRRELLRLGLDVEFELVRVQYLDLVESCSDVMDAVKFASEELTRFHTSHAKAGIAALPAMRKLVAVMDTKMTNWETLEELPVELPIPDEHRYHTVFACPVSKEESTPSNPPILLKCGHVICKACVKRISFNMTRRFKCPTCPVEQTECETRELFF